MKRTLLFSASLLAVAAMTVNAQTALNKSLDLGGLAEQPTMLKKSIQKFTSIDGSVKDLATHQFKSSLKAAEEDFNVAYMMPGGSFYWGNDINTGSFLPNFATAPIYGDVTFINLTSEGATSQTWTYDNPENPEEQLTSTDYDLTLNYSSFSIYTYPKLSASNGSTTSEYQIGQGKGAIVPGANPSVVIPMLGIQGMTGDEAIFGSLSNPGVTEGYGTLPDNNNTEFYGGKVQGLGMLLLKPDVQYALSRVFFNLTGVTSSDENAEFTVTAYKVDESGNLTDEVLGTATCPVSKATAGYYDETSWFEFVFKTKNGALSSETPINVNSAVFLMLTAPDGVVYAPVLNLSYTTLPEYANSYAVTDKLLPLNGVTFTDKEDKELYVMSMNVAFDFMYSWLFSVNDDYKYHAPVEGGSKTFSINSLLVSDSWVVEDDQEALYDWVNYTTEDNGETTELTFEVNSLPSDMSGRYTHVTVSSYAASAVFTISQGDATGVESVDSSALIVTVENGNFVVKGSNASAVEVYNVSGQKVADAAVEGETVVDAQNLESGLYILKFNDNKVVKIVK